MPTSFVTSLPDVTGVAMDASVQSELTVESIAPSTNYGDYRIRWREADAASYPGGNEAAIGHATAAYTIAGLFDGEQYDVGVRSETEHVTGAWHTAQEVTKLVPADALQSSNATKAGTDLSWNDNSSPLDGTYQIYRDREDYDYADPDGGLVGTVDSTATSFTDTTASPNTTYEYTVRAVTQWAQSSSDPTTTTTAGPDIPKTRTRRAEWTAEIRLDDRTLRPPIVDEPQIQPRANDLPKIRLPTTEGPWTRLDLENGAEDMIVWYDGVRQPIEDLERVEEADDDGHVLVGRGGTELLDRVEVGVDQRPVHSLVEDLLQKHTSYNAVVDAPPQDLSEETIFDVTSASAWANLFANTDLSRIPVDVDDSTAELYNQRSCWAFEGELPDRSNGPTTDQSTEFSGESGADGTGIAEVFDSSEEYAEYDITTDYTIPESNLRMQHRLRVPNSGNEIAVYIDDNVYGVWGSDFQSTSGSVAWWREPSSFDRQWTGDLEPGDHTIRYECTSSPGSGSFQVDVFALYDDRYSYNFDDTVTEASDGTNYLDGPEEKPEIEVGTDLEALVLSAVGADVTTVWDNTSGAQRIQVTNDGGASWYPQDGTESNTQTISHDWSDPGASIGVRLRFGRHGSRESTPATGFEGQRVDSLELTATLDDTPLAVNQAWDTSLRDVLRDLAEQAGALWDVEWGPNGLEINWTLPGQRQATVDAAVTTYDVATDVREQAARVVVLGGNAHQVGDRVTANHGTAVDLQQSDLTPGRESVYDPDTGASYLRDDDYEIDYNDGTITTIATGDIGDGATIAVDYDYETRGAFESDEATTDRSITRNITGLTSDRQCAIAARRISLELREPLVEAEVGVQPGPRSWSVVDQLDIEALPDVQALDVKEITTQAGEVRLRLGSRQSVEEIVSEIQDNTDRVARRV